MTKPPSTRKRALCLVGEGGPLTRLITGSKNIARNERRFMQSELMGLSCVFFHVSPS